MKVKAKNGERITKYCLVCNTMFEVKPNAKAMSQKYCCRECYKKDARTLPDANCVQCGKLFHPKFIDRNKYCSKECKIEFKANENKERIIKREAEKLHKELNDVKKCIECGKRLPNVMIKDGIKRKTRTKHCSIECQKATYAKRWFKVLVVRKANEPKNECATCGKEFKHEYGNKKRVTCSEDCQLIYLDVYKKKREYISRMRFMSQYKQHVNRWEIFKRDNYTCMLCGTPLDMTRKKKGEQIKFLSPTLDHITPLAKGGLHEPNNIQSAHFICNSYKGNRTYFDVNKIRRYLKHEPVPYVHNPMRYISANWTFTDMVEIIFG